MPISTNSVDFGLDLLINKKKVRSDGPSPAPIQNSSDPIIQQPQAQSSFQSEILNNSDSLFTNIDLDKELNTMDLGDIARPPPPPSMTGPSLPNFGTPAANGTTILPNYMTQSTPQVSTTVNAGSQMSFEEIQQKKFDLLCKFERLRDKGVKLPKTFSMSSNWEEMDLEYKRLIEHRQLDNSVKAQKKMLLSFVSGIEMLNTRFDPFKIQLDGWSENINENINDGEYDQIFEELFYKYRDSMDMAPELKLVGHIAMSGFWYHITQNMAKTLMPNLMNNVMKQNPDLMNQFKQATMNSVQQTNPGFAGFMNTMSPPKYNPTASPPFANPQAPPPRGSTNINSSDDIDALIDSIGGTS
jgi:hypothetical protein